MANYHTLGDVRALLIGQQVPIDATSEPSETEVTEFIEDTERYVDARLRSAGYTVPLTDSDAKRIVGEICTMLTAAKVYRIAVRSRGGEAEYAEALEKTAEARLARIHSGELALTAAEGADVGPTSTFPSDIKPHFETDQEW